MSENAPHVDTRTDDRYAALEIGDGDIIIYDREETGAWLQSDYRVEPAA